MTAILVTSGLMSQPGEKKTGAQYLGKGACWFRVWAPRVSKLELHLIHPNNQIKLMESDDRGYFSTHFEGVEAGALYRYRLEGSRERADPASRFQPRGIHGPSQVVDPHFPWNDAGWGGAELPSTVFYELHVGTFTEAGTFEAIIPYLDGLKQLGITALELMPVAQFPGSRNWGYDGVFPFAVQNSYGGPSALKRFVSACHSRNLAVVLDVVYNHLGPEGNYLADFGPYFTDRYKTPWGRALNFDDADSGPVRQFFIENALYWIEEFHIDALRLDAVHAILDHSGHHFLQELGEAVHRRAQDLNRHVFIIPESALNDSRIIRSKKLGGFNLDAQWNDDFHHALRSLLTREKEGYYEDYGKIHHLCKAFREGFVYSGDYSAFRRCRYGNSSRSIPAHRFVVYSQNHDQVGNRMDGKRLNQLIDFEQQKLAAATVLLSPFIPLLFMGEEYGEGAPFLYFVDHSDAGLIESVRRGRKAEFAAFGWKGEPPDPQAPETFLRSKLRRDFAGSPRQGVLRDFYRELIRLRKTVPSLAHLSKKQLEVTAWEEEKVICLRRRFQHDETLCLLHYDRGRVSPTIPVQGGPWRKILDSTEDRWLGAGSSVPDILDSDNDMSVKLNPHGVTLFQKGKIV